MTTLRLVAVLAAAFAALLAGPARADDPSLQVDFAAGWDGGGVAGAWVPLWVHVANTSPTEFRGTLVLRPKVVHSVNIGGALDPNVGTIYEQPITIPAHGDKTVAIYGQVVDHSAYEAVLLDSLGREAVASAQAGVSSGILSVALMSEVTGGESSLKAAKGPRQVGVVRYGSAQGFPSNPLFLGGIAAVVIEDFDASTLSQAQLSAIAEYVGLGGNLVLAGGPAWRRTLSQLPTALLPLHPSATGSASLKPIATLAGRDTDLVAPVVLGEVQRGARVLLGDPNGPPLAVEADYGAGRIVELAFDPGAAPIAQSGDLPSLAWQEVYGMAAAGPTANSAIGRQTGTPWIGPLPAQAGAAGGAASGSLIAVPARPLGRGSVALDQNVVPLLLQTPASVVPPVGLLGGLLIAYILLAGPVNYAAVRAIGRRELMWATVPLIAVVFTAGTYATGLIRHGSDYVVTEVSVLRVAPDGAVDTVSYDGLFSPRRGDVSVQLASDVLASTSIGYYDTTPADDRVILKRVPEVVLRNLALWSSRAFKTESFQPAHPSQLALEAHLSLQGTHITGTVTNHGKTAVQRLALATTSGQRAELAANLAPGATLKVDRALATAPVAWPYTCGVGVNVRSCQIAACPDNASCASSGTPSSSAASQSLREVAVEQAAAADLFSRTSDFQALVAVVDTKASLTVEGSPPGRKAVAASVAPVKLEAVDKLLPGWATAQPLISISNSNRQTDVYDFELPATVGGPLVIDEVGSAGIAQGKPFFRQPLVTYEVYDWAKGDWVTFDPSKPAVLTGGETAGGVVRVRTTSDLGFYIGNPLEVYTQGAPPANGDLLP